MKNQRRNQVQPWGSNELTGINVFCRSKIPIIPDLGVGYSPVPLAQFDYDFVHERQVIADHDQYLEVKSRLESVAVKPSGPPTTVSHTQLKDASITCEASLRSHSPLKTISTAPMVQTYPSTSRLASQSTNITVAPPVAARQLILGQVLQPSKTEPAALSEAVFNNQPYKENNTAISDNLSTSVTPVCKNAAGNRPMFLKDFESGPDDPFGSAELKTINDLEELSSVLSSVVVSKTSIPSTKIGGSMVNAQSLTLPPVSPLQTHSLGRRSPSPKPPVHLCPTGGNASVVSPNQTAVVPNHGIISNAIACAHSRTINHLQTSGPYFARPYEVRSPQLPQPNGAGQLSPKPFSSSVPNLEVVSVDRPHSITTNADVHKIYRPIAVKPVTTFGNTYMQSTLLRPHFSEFAQQFGQSPLAGNGRICRTPDSFTSTVAGGASSSPHTRTNFSRSPRHPNSSCGP